MMACDDSSCGAALAAQGAQVDTHPNGISQTMPLPPTPCVLTPTCAYTNGNSVHVMLPATPPAKGGCDPGSDHEAGAKCGEQAELVSEPEHAVSPASTTQPGSPTPALAPDAPSQAPDDGSMLAMAMIPACGKQPPQTLYPDSALSQPSAGPAASHPALTTGTEAAAAAAVAAVEAVPEAADPASHAAELEGLALPASPSTSLPEPLSVCGPTSPAAIALPLPRSLFQAAMGSASVLVNTDTLALVHVEPSSAPTSAPHPNSAPVFDPGAEYSLTPDPAPALTPDPVPALTPDPTAPLPPPAAPCPEPDSSAPLPLQPPAATSHPLLPTSAASGCEGPVLSTLPVDVHELVACLYTDASPMGQLRRVLARHLASQAVSTPLGPHSILGPHVGVVWRKKASDAFEAALKPSIRQVLKPNTLKEDVALRLIPYAGNVAVQLDLEALRAAVRGVEAASRRADTPGAGTATAARTASGVGAGSGLFARAIATLSPAPSVAAPSTATRSEDPVSHSDADTSHQDSSPAPRDTPAAAAAAAALEARVAEAYPSRQFIHVLRGALARLLLTINEGPLGPHSLSGHQISKFWMRKHPEEWSMVRGGSIPSVLQGDQALRFSIHAGQLVVQLHPSKLRPGTSTDLPKVPHNHLINPARDVVDPPYQQQLACPALPALGSDGLVAAVERHYAGSDFTSQVKRTLARHLALRHAGGEGSAILGTTAGAFVKHELGPGLLDAAGRPRLKALLLPSDGVLVVSQLPNDFSVALNVHELGRRQGLQGRPAPGAGTELQVSLATSAPLCKPGTVGASGVGQLPPLPPAARLGSSSSSAPPASAPQSSVKRLAQLHSCVDVVYAGSTALDKLRRVVAHGLLDSDGTPHLGPYSMMGPQLGDYIRDHAAQARAEAQVKSLREMVRPGDPVLSIQHVAAATNIGAVLHAEQLVQAARAMQPGQLAGATASGAAAECGVEWGRLHSPGATLPVAEGAAAAPAAASKHALNQGEQPGYDPAGVTKQAAQADGRVTAAASTVESRAHHSGDPSALQLRAFIKLVFCEQGPRETLRRLTAEHLLSISEPAGAAAVLGPYALLMPQVGEMLRRTAPKVFAAAELGKLRELFPTDGILKLRHISTVSSHALQLDIPALVAAVAAKCPDGLGAAAAEANPAGASTQRGSPTHLADTSSVTFQPVPHQHAKAELVKLQRMVTQVYPSAVSSLLKRILAIRLVSSSGPLGPHSLLGSAASDLLLRVQPALWAALPPTPSSRLSSLLTPHDGILVLCEWQTTSVVLLNVTALATAACTMPQHASATTAGAGAAAGEGTGPSSTKAAGLPSHASNTSSNAKPLTALQQAAAAHLPTQLPTLRPPTNSAGPGTAQELPAVSTAPSSTLPVLEWNPPSLRLEALFLTVACLAHAWPRRPLPVVSLLLALVSTPPTVINRYSSPYTATAAWATRELVRVAKEAHSKWPTRPAAVSAHSAAAATSAKHKGASPWTEPGLHSSLLEQLLKAESLFQREDIPQARDTRVVLDVPGVWQSALEAAQRKPPGPYSCCIPVGQDSSLLVPALTSLPVQHLHVQCHPNVLHLRQLQVQHVQLVKAGQPPESSALHCLLTHTAEFFTAQGWQAAAARGEAGRSIWPPSNTAHAGLDSDWPSQQQQQQQQQQHSPGSSGWTDQTLVFGRGFTITSPIPDDTPSHTLFTPATAADDGCDWAVVDDADDNPFHPVPSYNAAHHHPTSSSTVPGQQPHSTRGAAHHVADSPQQYTSGSMWPQQGGGSTEYPPHPPVTQWSPACDTQQATAGSGHGHVNATGWPGQAGREAAGQLPGVPSWTQHASNLAGMACGQGPAGEEEEMEEENEEELLGLLLGS
ncbi:hypothetical protein V8C86DRAFT_74544 [Haematococcus lacustris]